MRKIISIAFDPEGNEHAVCDDGSIWFLAYSPANEYEWTRSIYPPIPQDEEAKE